jgi:ketosteroid isomerase-like protein
MPNSGIEAVKRLHKALGRADADAINAAVTEDFSWHMVGLGEFPIGQLRQGGQGMVDYITDLLDVMEFQRVVRHTYLEEGETVVSLGSARGSVKANGKTVESDYVQVFTVRDGKVAHAREYVDVDAFRGALQAP